MTTRKDAFDNFIGVCYEQGVVTIIENYVPRGADRQRVAERPPYLRVPGTNVGDSSDDRT